MTFLTILSFLFDGAAVVATALSNPARTNFWMVVALFYSSFFIIKESFLSLSKSNFSDGWGSNCLYKSFSPVVLKQSPHLAAPDFSNLLSNLFLVKREKHFQSFGQSFLYRTCAPTESQISSPIGNC